MSLNKSWLTITLPCVDNFFLQIFFKIFSLIVKQHAVRKPRFSRVRKRGKTLPIAFKSHKMVGVLGFEPRTSSLSGTRSNQLSYKSRGVGGGSRIRTGDILLAKQALYQLSHAPRGGTRPALSEGRRDTDREGDAGGSRRASTSGPKGSLLLRKEVIQPLVPQRLPCYDFIPITTHTLGRQTPDFGCRRLS